MFLLPPIVRRLLLPAVALWLALAALAAWGPLVTSTGLVATWFEGPDWTPPAVLTSLEHVGRGDWVEERAARFGRAPFSVAWHGWLAVASASTFDLAIQTDGQPWLYLDDTEVIDGDQALDRGARRAQVTLAAGLHRVRLDFRSGPAANLQVLWARAGNPLHDMGQDVFFPTWPASYLAVAWRPFTLLATLASGGLLALLAAAGAHAIRRQLDASGATARERAWLWRVLALAAALMAWQIWFGLPERWEIDELVAADVVPAAQRGFADGWYDLYPALYFAALSVLSWPFMAGATAGALDVWSPETALAQVVLYRVATALCGLSIVYLAYRCAWEAFAGRAAALWTAFLCAVMPLVVYLAKFAKADLPYTAAFMAAMLPYLRALRDPSPAHVQRFAFFGMVAICLKDQAYGLVLLPAAHLVWLRARQLPGAPLRRLAALVRDPALTRAALIAIGTFVVGHNLPFNVDGFLAHLGVITGGASTGFRTYPPTIAGQAEMLVDGLAIVPWMFGWPGALAVAAGLGLAWQRRRVAVVALLLPIASYYLTFIAVIGYQYDRFYLAPAALLAIPGGLALAALTSRRAVWATGAAAIVAAYSLAQGASIDQMMAADSRLTAEAWLRDKVRPGETVGLVGPRAYLPRGMGLPSVDVNLDWEEIALASPEYLVVNLEYARRPRQRPFYQPLLDDSTPNYRRVATFKSPPGLAPLAYFTVFRNGEEDPFTNLDKINPEVAVFARRDVRVN